MKRIMMSAAVLALLATGCQNEVLVEQSQPQEGQLFTLEVGRGISSRTEMGDNNATNWSTDDAIFVSGENGGVHGVLKFVGYGENKSIATFSGYISGGQPSKLKHIVFPVPQDGKIDMSARNPEKLDAPMIGTIGGGAVQTLNNVGGLLAFKMIGGEGNVYGVSATEGSNNMTGGYYTFDAENGTLEYNPVDNVTSAVVMEDGYVYVPVATTTNETDGTGTETEVTVDVTVTNLETETTVITSNGVEITSGEIMGDDENEETGLDTGVIEGEEGAVAGTIVSNLDELNTAIEIGENVVFANDITGDLTIVQQPDVQIAINGNNKKFFGTITVNGKSARYETAGLTIKNVNFQTCDNSLDASIRLGGNDAIRYTNNVTVEGCSFNADGKVAVKSYTGGDWNLVIKDCVVSDKCHSLAQLANVEKGLQIIGCEVYSKNGVNLNQTPSLFMDDCTFDVRGYAVRIGVNGTVGGSTKSFEIVNSTLESACEEDEDAVIIFRDSAKQANLTLTNTTLIGAREFIGAEDVTFN